MGRSDNASAYSASTYDLGVVGTIPFYSTIHEQTIDLVKTVRPHPALWLDTGCGTGKLIESALPAFPDTRFILADPSEGMLARAKERLKGAAEGRVRFLPPMTSEALSSQEDNRLRPQVITAILCHHYLKFPQRRAAIRSCYDLLDNGGLFVTFENIAPDSSTGVTIGLERWRRFQVGRGKTPSDAQEHIKRYNRDYFPLTAVEHLGLLRDAGFEVVELFWLSHMQAGSYAIKQAASPQQ